MSARCYSERLPATQQQRQQEQHSRPGRGQDSRQGSRPGQRKPNPFPRKPANTGHASETSGMGTEPDNADAQVKRFADPTFGSLCTPLPRPPDYLDVCDSSGRPSTNGSPDSADEDSASASTSTWYAELDVSAESGSDEDGLSHPQPADAHDSEGEGFSAGGFECVDVALESGGEEAGRGVGPKMVPKRQIHLRRCSTEESLAAVSEGFVPGAPPQRQGHPKTLLCRQYSTPATIQGGAYEARPESPPSNRKQRFQKSLSLDETSTRTKMASSLIKNVLSKKMQFELKIQQQNPEEGAISQTCHVRETPKTREGKLPPGLQLGRSLSQEAPPCQDEPGPQGGLVHQRRGVSTETHQDPLDEPSLRALQSGVGRPGEPLSWGAGRSKSQLSRRENPEGLETQLADNSKASERERRFGDLAKTSAGSGASVWAGAAGRAEGERQLLPRNGKQPSTGSRLPPEPPQTALAPCAWVEKTASDCLHKNVGETLVAAAAQAARSVSGVVLEDREMLAGGGETGNREESQRGQTVAPLHRVRDMRKLVKSTYSSPFSFSGTSGERHPGKNMAAPARLSAKTQLGGAGEMGSLPAIVAPAVPELGVREARVPPVVQKPLAKGTSAKKTTVTGYGQRLTELVTTPSYLTDPTSGYREQPQKVRGGATVSLYKQQQAPATTAAAPARSRLPTATATPSYKMPRHDLTCCPSEGAPTGGMRENFGPPPTRSQDHYPPSSVDPVQSRAKDSHSALTPPSLHPTGILSYPTASFNAKNPDPMQTSDLTTCPAPLLLPCPKDTAHPLPDQARDGHGTPQSAPPKPSELAWGKPERGRSRSPHRPPPDARPAPYPCGPGGPPAPFTPELESPEGGAGKVPYLAGGGTLVFGQNPRRLLLDPETGTCFYVEMPAQPRRKVLFDPESGQYMEVLLPPQAMYPPSINPCLYPYLPSPGIYPPQYLPYSVLSMPQGP